MTKLALIGFYKLLPLKVRFLMCKHHKVSNLLLKWKALDNNDLNQVESAMFALSCGIPNGNVPKAKQIYALRCTFELHTSFSGFCSAFNAQFGLKDSCKNGIKNGKSK